MPGSEVLLDTNALIALSRDDSALIEVVGSYGIVSLSLFTMAEMEYGVAKSARPEENRRRLHLLIENFEMRAPDLATARVYGDVFDSLRRKGKPIPTNDVWIASLALQRSVPLLTRDVHFQNVEGLTVSTW